ncbi:hypothetical protein DL770_002344 [Monosporascus sp. CRB-9-2]|nr:hypothetical protein DL770_002344 [Monosporascus sp. CRB-9-2]
MRILCLHGMGTSSEIFAVRTAAIRSALSQTFSATFDFVDGALEWPPAPGITAFARLSAGYFANYGVGQLDTITQATGDLAEYVR